MLSKFLLRLSFPRKFAFIGASALFLVVGLIGQISVLIWDDVDFTRREQAGLEYLQTVIPVITGVQAHRQRALDAIADASKKSALTETQQGLGKAVAAAREAGAQADRLFDTANVARLLLERTEQINAAPPTDAEQVRGDHDRLAADWMEFVQIVANRSNLTLDPEFPTYYGQDMALVRLLPLLETVAQARIDGLEGIARKAFTLDVRVGLLNARSTAQQAVRDLRVGLEGARQLPGIDGAQLNAELADIELGVDVLGESIQQVALEGNLEHSGQAFADESDNLYKAVNQVILPLMASVDAGLEQRIRGGMRDIAVALSASLLVGLAVVYLFWLISHQISTGARQIGDASSELARGDCTVRVDFASGDELGAIARRFNRIAESFSALLNNVQRKSADVAQAADNIAAAAAGSSRSARDESEAASAIAAAVEEMTNSLGETARLTEQAADRSRESGRLANDGQTIANSASQEILKVADRVRDSAKRIEQLDARSADIDAIVNTIHKLAEQTNLLALNAAIEAARAGDAGRGFAVVADEVRSLAERTREATRAIGEIVESIQADVRSASSDIFECTERVNATVNLAGEVSTALQRIQDSAQVTLSEVAGIEAATREQSVASQEIAKSISNIAEMIEETSVGAEQSAQVAESMRALAADLKGAVSQFKA